VTVVLALLIVILAVTMVFLYNQLIARRQMTNNGWADIDVQLKRRADLVPQLVSVVQGYAAHERQLFIDVAEKRTLALAAGDDPQRRGAAETDLARPLGRLIALGEGYPELKASQHFLDLQTQLADTENKIEMARRFYNGAVRELNTSVESFPSNLVAAIGGVSKRAFFQIGAGEGAATQVTLRPS
jgi:LemA protein